MAYSGGVYTKPVKSKGLELAQIYAQGQRAIVQMREQVAQTRSKELDSYTKKAADVVSTGLSDFDNLVQKGVSLMKEDNYLAHEENRRGTITRSDATARINRNAIQASQLANTTKIVQKTLSDIDGGIESGKISSYTKDRYLRNWFTDKNQYPRYFKVSDGKGGVVNVPANHGMQVSYEDGKLQYIKSFNDVNPNTGEEYTASRIIPTSEFVDTNPVMFKPFEIKEWVDDLGSTIGSNRELPVVRGEELDTINYTGYTLGDTKGFYRVIAPERLKDISNTIEREIAMAISDDNNVISFLAEEFGARAPGDQNYRGTKSEKEILELFGGTQVLGEDGQPTGQVIPKIYGANGEQIVFQKGEDGYTVDPTVFQVDAYGNEIITDDQRKLMGGILRDRMLKYFNVKVDDYKVRDRLSKEDQKDLNITLATENVYDPSTDTYKTDVIAGVNPIRNAVMLETLGMGKDINVIGEFDKVKREIMNRGSFTDSPSRQITNTQLSGLVDFARSNKTKVTGVNISSAVKEVIEGEMSLTSTLGNKLENTKQIYFLDDTTGTKLPQVVILGDAVVAESMSMYEQAMGGIQLPKDSVKLNAKKQVVTKGVKVLDPDDVSSLYAKLYQNDETFKNYVESKGFKGIQANHEKFGKNQKYKALQFYFNNIRK